jgi:hypothetical protein
VEDIEAFVKITKYLEGFSMILFTNFVDELVIFYCQ